MNNGAREPTFLQAFNLNDLTKLDIKKMENIK